MAGALYLDTSAALRAVIESGMSPDVERRLREATALLASRLALVESARVMIRLRLMRTIPEEKLSEAERDIDAIWRRCEILELTPAICDLAAAVSPGRNVRALDALHLASFLAARRRIENLDLLTADERLRDAAAPFVPPPATTGA